MNKLINTVATLGLAAGLALASSSASAQLDFTIDEGAAVPGVGVLVTADLINGAYQEAITFTGPCGATCLNFSTTAIATFSQLTNNGAPVASLLSASPAPGVLQPFSYGMYALFTSVGQVNAGPGGPVFSGDSGSIGLYLDPSADNLAATTPPNGLVGFGVNDTEGDDVLLATASMLTDGEGSIILGTGGFFDLIWRDFELTAAGSSIFVAPDPFHLIVNVDGDFNQFDPFNPLAPTQFLTGDVSAVFLVPEPTTLALMGASLIGFGAARRSKK